ncbi:PadR family transcriptional regulator [Actinomyces faecalis]|uniref:PadR family transcriptional regulator n=1 Tax=Actinomyces faecalis TaxID=2722820 RepID=UPI0015524D3D|nr:PadR family transcriptional regulator [Actinomyces faecalis]
MSPKIARAHVTTGYPPAWLRGFLPAAVLAVISRGRTYGYAITQALEAAGLGHVKGGALYPVLTTLEKDGLVKATWVAGDGGPGRKMLTLTEAGHSQLEAYATQWTQFSGTIGALLLPPQKAALAPDPPLSRNAPRRPIP